MIKSWPLAVNPLTIPSSDQVVVAEELLFDEDAEYGVSTKGSRPVGTNDVGMVGFSCTFRTPEYPEGREVVIVANDVTYQSGSFGVAEDDFFAKVTGLRLLGVFLGCTCPQTVVPASGSWRP